MADRFDMLNPKKLNLSNVLGIFIRSEYSIAVTINDEIYMWGDVNFGTKQIGITCPILRTEQPVRVSTGLLG